MKLIYSTVKNDRCFNQILNNMVDGKAVPSDN